MSRDVVFDEISLYYGAATDEELNLQKSEAVELSTSFNTPNTCMPAPYLQQGERGSINSENEAEFEDGRSLENDDADDVTN